MTSVPFPAFARPIVAAPMAGGPSTPDLVVAVTEAGGLGFLAAGYLKAPAVRQAIGQVRARTTGPFGVNVFVPSPSWVAPPSPALESDLGRYVDQIAPDAQRLGVAPGAPRPDDDDWDAKVALLVDDPVAVVSFTFGCPDHAVVDALHTVGTAVLVTVTSVPEAETAAAAGADALVVQGAEAGAHRGSFTDSDHAAEDAADDELLGLLPLLRLVAAAVPVPLVATGGISDGAGVAAALAGGAVAVQLGTAFLRCPEAGTSATHRNALRTGGRSTALTRAFTGRTARGLVNGFLQAHSGQAPAAYPQVHQLTAPLRAAARDAGDPEGLHLWAGQAYPLGRELPAAALVEALVAEAADAVQAAGARLQPPREP